MRHPDEIAATLLGVPYAQARRARPEGRAARGRTHSTSRETWRRTSPPRRGQRAADAVARFGGSWTFIALFTVTLLGWVGLNAWLVRSRGQSFDPYPYILLNLFLSMLAAIQAPIILMSQNRQSQKDRLSAEHDYEVNLKAELEIMLLHDKLDDLREKQWQELLAMQKEQLALLASLAGPAFLSTGRRSAP